MKLRIAIPAPASDFHKVGKALDDSKGKMNRAEAASLVHLSASQFSRQFRKNDWDMFSRRTV